jgi:hypothetical protein
VADLAAAETAAELAESVAAESVEDWKADLAAVKT